MVQLFTADLDAVDAPDEALLPLLSTDERGRAARFTQPAHRRRYLVAHVFLRSVLGRCVSMPPEAIGFDRTDRGKPVLRRAASAQLHFSLSHTEATAVCAVASREVGVDVEHQRSMAEEAGVAARIFTAGRLAAWKLEPDRRRAESLLVGWTQFEALAKAQGGGLLDPPRPIGLDGTVDQWHSVSERAADWSVITLRPDARTILSVSLRGGPASLSVETWWGPPLGA
jgi:4'-phosphopantetheinyl transferase